MLHIFVLGEVSFLLGLFAAFVALRYKIKNDTGRHPKPDKARKHNSKPQDDWPLGAYTHQNHLCVEPKPRVYLKSNAEIRAAATRIYPGSEKWHVHATGMEAVKIEEKRAASGINPSSQKKNALFRNAEIAALLKAQSSCESDCDLQNAASKKSK